MKKRLLALALALCLSLSLLPATAFAVDGSKITWFGTTAEYPNLEKDIYPGGYRLIQRDRMNGVIDSAGNTLISFLYSKLIELKPGQFLVELTGAKNSIKKGVLNLKNEEVIPVIYEKLEYKESLYLAKKDGKWGALSLTGQVLIPFEYEELQFENTYYLAEKDGKWGIISTQNQVLCPFNYNSITPTKDGTFIFQRDYRYGIMDGNYKETCPPTWKGMRYLGDGNYEIYQTTADGEKDYGTIDQNGKTLIPISETILKLSEFSEGLAIVTLVTFTGTENDQQFVNSKGQYLSKPKQFIMPYGAKVSEGLAFAMTSSGKGAFYNSSLQAVIPNVENASTFQNGIATAKIGGTWYIIDKTGKKLAQMPDEALVLTPQPEDGELIRVDVSNEMGFMDKNWNLVIPAKHSNQQIERTWDEETGVHVLVKKGTSTIIVYDKNGNVLIPEERFCWSVPKEAPHVDNGYIIVTEAGKNASGIRGAIDLKGNVVIPFQQKYVSHLGGGIFRLANNTENAWAVNLKGETVIPEQKNITYNPIILVVQNGKVGWLLANDLDTYGPEKAAPNASKVLVDGKEVSFDAYTINQNNYFKLRDLAMALNGTDKRFSVGWDQATNAIPIVTGAAYVPNGGELQKGDGTAKQASQSNSKVTVNGNQPNLAAYLIGQNNYFKLRDLMKIFDVYVGWDQATSTITLDTTKTYDGAGAAPGVVPDAGKIKTTRPTDVMTSHYDYDNGGEYYISIGQDGKKLLAPQDGNSAPGTKAVMSTTMAEKHIITQEGAMGCRIQSVQTGLYLTVEGEHKAGSPLTYRPKTDDGSQRFTMTTYVKPPQPNVKELQFYIPSVDRHWDIVEQNDGTLAVGSSEGRQEYFMLTQGAEQKPETPKSKFTFLAPEDGLEFYLTDDPNGTVWVSADVEHKEWGGGAISDIKYADVFRLEKVDDTYYRILNTRTQTYLSVNGNKHEAGTGIIHWGKSDDGSQLFKFKKSGDYGYFIITKKGYYVTLAYEGGAYLVYIKDMACDWSLVKEKP